MKEIRKQMKLQQILKLIEQEFHKSEKFFIDNNGRVENSSNYHLKFLANKFNIEVKSDEDLQEKSKELFEKIFSMGWVRVWRMGSEIDIEFSEHISRASKEKLKDYIIDNRIKTIIIDSKNKQKIYDTEDFFQKFR